MPIKSIAPIDQRFLYKRVNNNNGAKNKNENSTGSVTPVKKDVTAIEVKMPATAFLFCGFA